MLLFSLNMTRYFYHFYQPITSDQARIAIFIYSYSCGQDKNSVFLFFLTKPDYFKYFQATVKKTFWFYDLPLFHAP